MQTDSPKALAVSKKEAAAMLSISMRSLENYLALKKIESRRIGRRRVVLISSLKRFLRADQASASPTRRDKEAAREVRHAE
jgi:hypothetical protein